MLASNAHSWSHELGQPLGAMTGSIDGGAAAGNAPTAVQGSDPIHHAGHILGDGQASPTITASRTLARTRTVTRYAESSS
jgi:hypothetical protein